MKELILKETNVKTLFMAALLACKEEYKEANVRLLGVDEEQEKVNVTADVLRISCPSWTNSELISSMIAYKVCAPIVESSELDVSEKVHSIKKVLKKYALSEGLQLPQ